MHSFTVGSHNLYYFVFADTYDALVIAGGMGEGHIPVAAVDEMIRVVKPGKLLNICVEIR